MMTDAQHAARLAEMVRKVAVAVSEVSDYWSKHDLPGDFSTVADGYPFPLSLDEMPAAIWAWADALYARYEEIEESYQ